MMPGVDIRYNYNQNCFTACVVFLFFEKCHSVKEDFCSYTAKTHSINEQHFFFYCCLEGRMILYVVQFEILSDQLYLTCSDLSISPTVSTHTHLSDGQVPQKT